MKLVYHGNESVSFLGPKIRDMLPDDCKDIDKLNTIKNKVKKWDLKIVIVGSVKFTLTI